jgi:tetratricopeptide (TPR) repeat protein
VAVAWLADAIIDTAPEEAMLLYQRAAELDPANDLHWRHIAELAEWEMPRIALEAARQACKLNPIADGSCFREARVAYRLGDWQRALDRYDFLLSRKSSFSPEDWARYILALQYLGRTDEAGYAFERAKAVAPADYGALFEVHQQGAQ